MLWERAGFNRWYPAMAGRRSQAVIRKFITEAACEIEANGIPLAERLYVPEPFQEDLSEAIRERRRSQLAMLHSPEGVEAAATGGQKIWLKHMSDCPLLIGAGDIIYRGKHTTVYVPIATSIVLSVVLSVVLYVISRFRH